MKIMKPAVMALGLCGIITTAQAQVATSNTIEVTLTNLTQGMYFTPRLLVAHTSAADLFEVGTAPSTPLAWLAEAGVIDDDAAGDADFGSLLESDGVADITAWIVGPGLVEPASTTMTYSFDTEGFEYLSMLSMLVPTNDAFVGLDSWKIPSEPGTYTIELNAYDAGSEGNDEINPTRDGLSEAETGAALGGYGVPGMAAPPPTQPGLGVGSTGVAVKIDANNQVADGDATREGVVHIHRNVLGDTDAEGGVSDLDATVHRWLNPVARLVVTVSPAAAVE